MAPGEALNYATQRVVARHSKAREFSKSQISKPPFANEIAPPSDAFKKLQAGGFVDWRLTVDGLVDHPGTFSVAQLKSYPSGRAHYGAGVRRRLVIHRGMERRAAVARS